MHARARALVLAVLAATAAGCTSFATVRSARVQPGPSLTLQGSVSSPPGDGAGWFWTLDCESGCDHAIGGVDALYTYGGTGETPYAAGVGVNGLFPYVEGYAQMGGDSARAWGVGARLGIPVIGWSSHQVYGRYDFRLADGRRVLWNPGVFLHVGNSPNGNNPGHFLALVQGVGLELRGARSTLVPALTLVAGRGERENSVEQPGPFTTVFGAASVSVTFHRRRTSEDDRRDE